VITPPAPASNEVEIKSPMVGTFYRAPSPEAANYVEIGAEVHPDSVVCIIEAMKVMNEIKAEVRGVITQLLVDNAKPVEFGQPLFKIRPM
jgi:acetyl-CoA carboxylase biotin carboxyl carrier protein